MSALATAVKTDHRLGLGGYAICAGGIAQRELRRFVSQRGRFFSSMFRPLVWLFIFAVGFRTVLGLSITPPYQTYVLYQVYVVPGLAVMIQLFNGMQSSLSMVYDREMGSMRVLLTAPFPRWSLLLAKLAAGTLVSLLQVYLFLAIAALSGIRLSWGGAAAALPAFILSGLMLGAIGLFLSSFIKQLENFSSVMNFVIFPMFFASPALYPLWKIRESSEALYIICQLNPFTWATELVRFALYGSFHGLACAITAGTTIVVFALAALAYDPSRGVMMRHAGAGRSAPS